MIFTNINNTLLKIISQEPSNLARIELDPIPCANFLNDTERNLDSWSKSCIAVLNYLLKCAPHFKELYMSQKTIAFMIGISHRQCNRIIKFLCELGLISKLKRKIKETCLYRISSYFYDIDVKIRLARYFSAFKWVAKEILFSALLINAPVAANEKNVHQDYLKEDIVYKCISYSSHDGRKWVTSLKLKNIDLTKAGKLRFALFPIHIIKERDKLLALEKNIINPVGWLYDQCKKLCQKEGIKLNYDRLNAFEKLFSLKRQDPSLKGKANLFPNPDSFFVPGEENPKRGMVDIHPDKEAQHKFDCTSKKYDSSLKSIPVIDDIYIEKLKNIHNPFLDQLDDEFKKIMVAYQNKNIEVAENTRAIKSEQ